MKPKSIKTIMYDYFKGTNLKEINQAINISTVWKNIVGNTIAKNTEIQKFKNGKITVKTSNPIWRNELIFQKEDLLNRLKKEEPELNIKEIEFR
ncbi:DUF721 domain-containing protein [Candidatus Marinimicrobia bacterium PRS2]|nr:DUF721 domain-containing protein [Candidatus Marinimicrobia bacterium PRS2]